MKEYEKESDINGIRRRGKQERFNLVAGLNMPEQLGRRLDAFDAGYLRDAVNIWDTLEQRDDLIRTVVSKRKKAVGREGWTVLPKRGLRAEQAAEAREHVAALEYFYNHLEAEHAVDEAEKGGFKLLMRQMMDAVGKRFAVHEVVWKREDTGDDGSRGLGNEAFAQIKKEELRIKK